MVAVFDVFALISEPEFIDFIQFILLESKIDLIGHSIKTDQYVLHYNFKQFNPYLMKRVIELNDVIKDPESGSKMGMLKMSETILGKTYSKTYQRSNWLRRPLSD